MIISDVAKQAAIKLPPDVLMHPIPFPDRLDYAEKIIQEAIDAALAEKDAEIKAAVEAFARIRVIVGANDSDPMPAEVYVQRMKAELESARRERDEARARNEFLETYTPKTNQDRLKRHAADLLIELIEPIRTENARLNEACAKEFADVERLSHENARLENELAQSRQREAEMEALVVRLREALDVVNEMYPTLYEKAYGKPASESYRWPIVVKALAIPSPSAAFAEALEKFGKRAYEEAYTQCLDDKGRCPSRCGRWEISETRKSLEAGK